MIYYHIKCGCGMTFIGRGPLVTADDFTTHLATCAIKGVCFSARQWDVCESTTETPGQGA